MKDLWWLWFGWLVLGAVSGVVIGVLVYRDMRENGWRGF